MTALRCVREGPAVVSNPSVVEDCKCQAGYSGVGAYHNEEGDILTDCTICAAGSYSPSNSSSCTPCPGGTYSPSAGRSVCLACPAGSYCPTGASEVIPCPKGLYCVERDRPRWRGTGSQVRRAGPAQVRRGA